MDSESSRAEPVDDQYSPWPENIRGRAEPGKEQ